MFHGGKMAAGLGCNVLVNAQTYGGICPNVSSISWGVRASRVRSLAPEADCLKSWTEDARRLH